MLKAEAEAEADATISLLSDLQPKLIDSEHRFLPPHYAIVR
jgi:hypothetical protein